MRKIEMTSIINGTDMRITVDVDADTMSVSLVEPSEQRPIPHGSVTISMDDFDKIVAEIDRFRRIQALVNEAPDDDAGARRMVS